MVGPLGVLATGPAAATTEAGDVDGEPPGGCCRDFRQRPPPMLKTSMAAPWGCWRQVQQQQPPILKTSIVVPLASMAI
jgi:hypothetical protein